MNKKPAFPDLCLSVSEETNRMSGEGYYHLRIRITTRKYEPMNGPVPYGCDDTYGDGPLYSGIQISCQGDERSALRDREPVYGFSLEYRDLYSCDLRKVRRMAKTLDTIDKALTKIADTRGYVQNFGDYVGRIAEAVRAESMLIQRDAKREEMTGHRWEVFTIGEGINRINALIYQWRRPYVEQHQERATA